MQVSWVCERLKKPVWCVVKALWLLLAPVLGMAFSLCVLVSLIGMIIYLLSPALFRLLFNLAVTSCHWAFSIVTFVVDSTAKKAEDISTALGAQSTWGAWPPIWSTTGTAIVSWISWPGCSAMNKIGIPTTYCDFRLPPASGTSVFEPPLNNLATASLLGTKIPYTVRHFWKAQMDVEDLAIIIKHADRHVDFESKAELSEATEGLPSLWSHAADELSEFADVLAIGLNRELTRNRILLRAVKDIVTDTGRWSWVVSLEHSLGLYDSSRLRQYRRIFRVYAQDLSDDLEQMIIYNHHVSSLISRIRTNISTVQYVVSQDTQFFLKKQQDHMNNRAWYARLLPFFSSPEDFDLSWKLGTLQQLSTCTNKSKTVVTDVKDKLRDAQNALEYIRRLAKNTSSTRQGEKQVAVFQKTARTMEEGLEFAILTQQHWEYLFLNKTYG